MHYKVSGFYKLQVCRPDGSVREAAEFPNLITDAGLNAMGDGSGYIGHCQVGSGSTAPTVSDTALSARIASTTATTSSTDGAQATSPYYAWRRKTFSFGTGAAAGNISEVGVGWSSTGDLFSRALVLDSFGSPTTITVLADETLYVTYEFRIYPKTTDDTGQIVLTGNIGGTYNYTWRASEVLSWGIGGNGTSMGALPSAAAYNGPIGAITTRPSGTSAFMGITAQPYSNNSLERRFDVGVTLAQANLAGGIRSIVASLGPTVHQIEFSEDGTGDPIPKTSSDTLNLVIAHSWGRA